jgi:hypothetical protein
MDVFRSCANRFTRSYVSGRSLTTSDATLISFDAGLVDLTTYRSGYSVELSEFGAEAAPAFHERLAADRQRENFLIMLSTRSSFVAAYWERSA